MSDIAIRQLENLVNQPSSASGLAFGSPNIKPNSGSYNDICREYRETVDAYRNSPRPMSDETVAHVKSLLQQMRELESQIPHVHRPTGGYNH